MDPLKRIHKIILFLEANPQGMSAVELAQVCGVTWQTILNDIKKALYSSELYLPIYSELDGEDVELSKPEKDVKWFLSASYAKTIPIQLKVEEILTLEEILNLLPEESEIKNSLMSKIIGLSTFNDDHKYRYIKGNLKPLYPIAEGVFATLQSAFASTFKVKFKFKDHEDDVLVAPLGLVYYSRLRMWYLVAKNGDEIKNYGLHHIKNLRLVNETYTYPKDFSLRAWFAPRWGMEYGEPFWVKVRFKNQAHTFDKVRRDTAHRECTLTLEKERDTLLYEDCIIGKNEFLAWILGFGAAAEVLEPQELRDEIVARVRETLKRYKGL